MYEAKTSRCTYCTSRVFNDIDVTFPNFPMGKKITARLLR